jgi:subtilisin family serine protease
MGRVKKDKKPTVSPQGAKVGASKLNRDLGAYYLEITAPNSHGYKVGETGSIERITALDLLDNKQAKLFHQT